MHEYERETDENLLKRLHSGEQDIMDYLLNKYKPLVRKKAKDMYLIGGEGEDLIQEGMIGLFKAIRDYCPEKEASFYTFADLCVSRQMYTAIQASQRMKHMPLNTYISLYASENDTEGEKDRQLIEQLKSLHADDPETLVMNREDLKYIMEHMSEYLSKFEQEVILLYMAGNNYSQIAGMLGKSSKSVDNALHRAKGKLMLMNRGRE